MANNKSFVFWEHLQAAITDLWTRFNAALARKVNASTYTAGMAGKADKTHKHEIADINELQEQLQALASTQGATEEKEVVSVDTYSDLEGLDDKSEGVVYITLDENKVYLYSEADDEFVEVTNEVVDNTIYVSNLNDLIEREYTQAGIYTVVHSYTKVITAGRIKLRSSKIDTYTLAVVASRSMSGRISRYRYTPYLTSKNGWAEIVTNSDDEKVWQWHIYSYNATAVTHEELLDMRDNGSLVAGQKYRIIDYLTTAYDEEGEVRSAEHPFDLLVTAVSANALAAKAIPLHSDRDGEGYFDGYDLEACEVWYDINNDTTKYKWADEENGTGVIYRMKDTNGNDLPYDFKNIQFKRYAITNIESSTLTDDALNSLRDTYCYDNNGGKHFATKDVWGNFVPTDNNGTTYEIDEDNYAYYYTFHGLASEDGETISEHYDLSTHPKRLTDECLQYIVDDGGGSDVQDMCKDNVMKPAYWEYFGDDEYFKGRRVLNNIVFINGLSYCYYNEDDGYWEYNTGYCYGNKFGVECKNSTFGNGCGGNTFGNYCYSNTFGNYFCRNSFGNYCYSNTFGNDCNNNTFGNYFCRNSFGNNCYNNQFGNNVRYLTVHSGVMYVNVLGSNGSSYVQNAQILNGTQGSNSSNKLTISFAANAKYTQFAGLNSSGILVIWTPADAA